MKAGAKFNGKNLSTNKKLILFLIIIILTIIGLLLLHSFAKSTTDHSADISKCYSDDNQIKCWESVIYKNLESNDLDAAFEVFGELYAKEPEFAVSCHSFSHLLGEAAYKKYAKDEDFGLTPKTSYCGFGFYHGFMENLLFETGEPKKASEFCDFVGKKLSGQTNDASGACFHGIGHGSVDGGDPRDWGDPQAMLKPGLSLCELVSSTKDQLYRCVTGAYNALEILSADPKYKIESFRENTFAFCVKQVSAYREACYTNMLPALLGNYGNDFTRIAKIVESIVEIDDVYTVRFMVLSGLFHEYYRVNLGRTDFAQTGVNLCRSLNSRSHTPCIEGLSGGLMKHGEPEKEYVKTLEFCANKLLSAEESSICYRRTLSTLGIWYSPEEENMICGLVPKEFNKYCLN